MFLLTYLHNENDTIYLSILQMTRDIYTEFLPRIWTMKKVLGEMQTLPAAVRRSQFFCPTADPLAGGMGQQKFNQQEMDTTITYKRRLVKIDSRNFELLWYRPTNPCRPPATDRTDNNTLRC